MTDNIIQLAETIQTASINTAPSPARDINPSTAADRKEPVQLDSSPDLSDLPSDVDEDEIPLSVLKPAPPRAQFPPLPDLRFEQSYLASIAQAGSWQQVAWITFRDQLFMPLAQGMLWTLLVAGWRQWNRQASFSGHTLGGRVRRWWWRTNNWKVPVSLRDDRLAGRVQEFLLTTLKYYQAEFASAGAD